MEQRAGECEMKCPKCSNEAVENQALGKTFHYCRTCKDEVYQSPPPTSGAELMARLAATAPKPYQHHQWKVGDYCTHPSYSGITLEVVLVDRNLFSQGEELVTTEVSAAGPSSTQWFYRLRAEECTPLNKASTPGSLSGASLASGGITNVVVNTNGAATKRKGWTVPFPTSLTEGHFMDSIVYGSGAFRSYPSALDCSCNELVHDVGCPVKDKEYD